MVGQGRTVGLVLVIIALVIGLAAGAYLLSGMAEGRLRFSGLLLGLFLILLIVLPLFGGGAYLLVRGRSEARQYAQVQQEKRVLNIVRTQGQVDIGSIAVEMNVPRDQVRSYVYDLVGKDLFTGYIDWNEGILYAREASEMQSLKCPNCGGVREFVGKGIVKCPYCGAELFLPSTER